MTARLWLDPELPVAQRVSLLLTEMTIAEKVGQLHQTPNLVASEDHQLIAGGGVGSSLFASGATAGNVRDDGMLAAAVDACQRIAVRESRLGIPLLFARDVIHGHRTIFPIPLGLAATWNPELATRSNLIAADEASGDGVAWGFSPMMDISEEPRWGRVAESLGEQPVLAGRLAAALVAGFQGEPAGRDGLFPIGSIAACAKHFVGYGMSAGGRDYDTVQVGENHLRNTHLRPFHDAVRAGCLTVMASFNDVDGIPMHAHRHLLREVLKGEWGFDGVVVADWCGVGQLVLAGVAVDLRDATRQAIEAGVDIDMCTGAYAAHLTGLVESGEVAMEVLDDAVARVLRLKFRLGLFDRPYVAGRAHRSSDSGPTADSRAVAGKAAAESLVLLSNNGILPLAADPGRVHLTGPFAEDGDALLGTWVLDGRGDEVVTPAAALSERLGQAFVVTDGRFSDVAVHEVRQCDLTIALVGEHRSRSGEDRGVSTLALPAGQLEMLEQLAGIGKPLVVVVFGGRPLELGRVMELADAVVFAWHPGTEAGTAVADLLFGDVDPVGRLPTTFPRSAGHIPTSSLQRLTGRPVPPSYDTRHGRYLDTPVPALFPFGFGLTWSHIDYSATTVDPPDVPSAAGSTTVSVAVTNTGDRAATETVQLYFHDPVAEVTRPIVELLDWQRVTVDPGATEVATFTVTTSQFGYYGRDLTRRVDAGGITLVAAPNAAAATDAVFQKTGAALTVTA